MSDNRTERGETALRLDHVSRAFGTLRVLDDLSLTVERGEFVVIVGPSGCGKTTLLNVLSGFDAPTGGTVQTQGVIRTVYQQDGLFPWLTVADNIRLGLGSAADAERQLTDLLALIRLEHFAAHYPHQLSGGMRQRVELARALAGDSDILLMDEPFSALDYQTRLRMRRELARLLHERPRTVVFVTHDIEEAAFLGDRIVVLTERPARILTILRLNIARPRALTDPGVIEAMQQIFDALGLDGDGQEADTLLEQGEQTVG